MALDVSHDIEPGACDCCAGGKAVTHVLNGDFGCVIAGLVVVSYFQNAFRDIVELCTVTSRSDAAFP
jgi:hypothetical protein